MNKFRSLTIDELMRLLIDLAKDNENQVSQYNKSISLLSKSDKPREEIRLKTRQLHELTRELIEENKKFVSLFKGLVDFNKFFNNHLELKDELDTEYFDEKEVNFAVNENSNLIDKSKEEEINSNIKSKSLSELHEILQQYILEEKYEECVKIKYLIEKVK